MKIAVLGSTGMAGHMLSTYLEEHGYPVYRSSRSEKNTETSRAIDATDFAALGAWLDEIKVDIVVNCIGLLQKACAARADLAVLVNSYLPHFLEQRSAQGKERVIHLSTDCVFSGAKGSYTEDAFADGDTMYDRSKALGEIKNDRDLTFRMSIIGPDPDVNGTGLFNWFMAQKGDIQGYSKTIWNGVTTLELARGVDAAIQQGLTGLYHLTPALSIDKYSLLQLFQQTFGKSDVTIHKVDGLILNKSLVNTRKDFEFEVRDYPRQITDMRQWVESHRALYPHYELV